MKRILLDNHIFDKLKIDAALCGHVRQLAEKDAIEIVISRTVAEELYKSPHIDVIERFPYTYKGNTVGRAGILCCGDSIGSGEIFYKHLGESRKFADALIVDAAFWHADWLVSDDDRLCRRAKPLLERCRVMSFSTFENEILNMTRNLTDRKNSHEPDS